MQIEYWALLVVGIPIGILLLLYFFAKAAGVGKSARKAGSKKKEEDFFTRIYGGLKGKLGGKIKRPKWSLWRIVKWTVVILFLFGVLYNSILEVTDRDYSAQELKNSSVGNCEVIGERVRCTGPFTITIAGPPGLTTIGGIFIKPGEALITQLDISAGSYPGVYLVKYRQGTDMSEFGNSVCGKASAGIYHQAMIYYNGIPKLQSCVAEAVVPGMAPERLYFGTYWLRAFPVLGGFFQLEDPRFYVGWKFISNSYIDDNPQVFMRYPIILSSEQGAWESTEIGSLGVTHSFYKLI